MSKFIIQGGKKLEGEVRISGSKNAALPIIAATVLVKGKTTLYNVPNIQDVQTMFQIIKDIGGKVTKKNNKVIIIGEGNDTFTRAIIYSFLNLNDQNKLNIEVNLVPISEVDKKIYIADLLNRKDFKIIRAKDSQGFT